MRVIAYVRVSTEEQRQSGAGLAAQRDAIAAEANRRGWEIVETFEDRGYSAKDLRRPGVQAALEALGSGDAAGLVVAKLDRLSRSMFDFTGLMQRAQRESWALVALDCVDTTTPAGEAMAHVLATFAQFERRLIGQRTREALAVRRQEGVRLGRPPAIPKKTERRIVRARANGATLRQIAAALNRDKIPILAGEPSGVLLRWRQSFDAPPPRRDKSKRATLDNEPPRVEWTAKLARSALPLAT